VFDYEVLILDEKANPRAFVEMQGSDDDDAVRSARDIANGRPFELWRDIACIHCSMGTVASQVRPISRWKGV
jgi:hypothetical protein